jgi:hypothetical protein
MPEARELPVYRASDGIEVGVWPWVLALAITLALTGAIVMAHRDLAAIAARDQAIAQARACGLPRNPGDRVVLVVHNRGGTLVATCRPVADLMSPEKGIME